MHKKARQLKLEKILPIISVKVIVKLILIEFNRFFRYLAVCYYYAPLSPVILFLYLIGNVIIYAAVIKRIMPIMTSIQL